MGADADFLICGGCHQSFPLDNLSAFLVHKKFDCELNDPLALFCHFCPEKFSSPWKLLQHAKKVHSLKLYKENSRTSRRDKKTTFTASQSFVQATYDDKRKEVVAECCLMKAQGFVVEGSNSEDESPRNSIGSGSRQGSPLREQNGSSDNDEIEKMDAATQVEQSPMERDEDYCCCSNQNCGVTVMPGTHERLMECCSAVVPKKRKRHMVTKHTPSGCLRRKKVYEGTKVVRTDSGDIFIDVDTSGRRDKRDNRDRESRGEGSSNGRRDSSTSRRRESARNSDTEQPGKSRSPGTTPSRDTPPRPLPGSKHRSVIIQPGTTFSIPVSYAVVQQPIVSKSKNGNVTNLSSRPFTPARSNGYPNTATNSKPTSTPLALIDNPALTIPVTPISQTFTDPTNNLTNTSLSNLVNASLVGDVINTNVTVTNTDLTSALPTATITTPIPLIQQGDDQTTIEVPLITDPMQHHQGESLPVPLIVNQIFQTEEEAHSLGSVNDGSDQVNSRDSMASDRTIDRTIDRTTKELISLVMGMTEEGMKDGATAVISDADFDNNLIIDQSESDPKENQTITLSHDNQIFATTIDSLNLDNTVPDSAGENSTTELDQSAHGNDGKNMKKRRYPTSRPFKCDQCGQAFNQRIHLRKHQSKHTGIKPFKCGECDYSTVERSHLKVHVRVHTGEKPYKCTYCEYATAQNSTLKIHLKRHHDSEPNSGHTCRTCGKKFKQQENLEQHYRQHDSVAEH